MKKIIYTQRVEIIESYGERRDCTDQHVADFIYRCGFLPVPIMNRPEMVESFCNELRPDGILLTGGNDLVAYGGNAPERDETERKLIKYATENSVPVLGICRGLQMIASYYGEKLFPVEGHIRVEHGISGAITREKVNSYHSMAVKSVSAPLRELARTEDGVIEAFMDQEKSVAAIMWHPERVKDFDKEDIKLVTNYFNGGKFV